MIRRFICVFLIALILGAMVSVLIAWGLATWGPEAQWNAARSTETILAMDAPWPRAVPDDWPRPFSASRNWAYGVEGFTWDSPPYDYGNVWLHLRQYGLPMRCLEVQTLGKRDGSVQRTRRGDLGPPPLILRPSPGRDRLIPGMPIWSGLAINALVYGSIIWAVYTICFLSRHGMRRGFGRCAACSYNMRGNTSGVCPECGHTR